jgi:hypothetical protein
VSEGECCVCFFHVCVAHECVCVCVLLRRRLQKNTLDEARC